MTYHMTYIMCRTLLAGGGTPSSAAAFYGVAPAGETPPASMSDSMAHGTSMPASMPASLSPPETVVEPEGVGVRTVCPARSCELTPLEPCDEPG